jgi:hypothetical protein
MKWAQILKCWAEVLDVKEWEIEMEEFELGGMH